MTRHPGAIFSSFAGSFFAGDYKAAHDHDPVLERYIPALAGLLRQDSVAVFHLRYEDLVRDSEHWMRKLCDYLEIPYHEIMIVYGNNHDQTAAKGRLGDPVGVGQHSRPTSSHMHGWTAEVANDPVKLQILQAMISALDDDDLKVIGYPENETWVPLDDLGGAASRKKRSMLNIYQMQRKMIVKCRSFVQRSKRVRSFLQ